MKSNYHLFESSVLLTNADTETIHRTIELMKSRKSNQFTEYDVQTQLKTEGYTAFIVNTNSEEINTAV